MACGYQMAAKVFEHDLAGLQGLGVGVGVGVGTGDPGRIIALSFELFGEDTCVTG